MDKQVYDLTIADISRSGVWFFPMDDSVEDELTVRPLLEGEDCFEAQVIVRTDFYGSSGEVYKGYLYWDGDGSVQYLKPVLFMDDGVCVSFWNGMIKPSWDDYPKSVDVLKLCLPISYESELILDFPVISGELEGLYYLEGNEIKFMA